MRHTGKSTGGRIEQQAGSIKQQKTATFYEFEGRWLAMCAGRCGAHWLGMPALTRAAAMAAGSPSGPSCWLPPENCSRAMGVGGQGSK
jgi:hypothetical protein